MKRYATEDKHWRCPVAYKPDHVVVELSPSVPIDPAQPKRCELRDTQHMLCRHCGERAPMPFGDVEWVVAVLNAFTKVHRRCKVKQESE